MNKSGKGAHDSNPVDQFTGVSMDTYWAIANIDGCLLSIIAEPEIILVGILGSVKYCGVRINTGEEDTSAWKGSSRHVRRHIRWINGIGTISQTALGVDSLRIGDEIAPSSCAAPITTIATASVIPVRRDARIITTTGNAPTTVVILA